MKHSIKRVQSQAGLSFAEREDVRPKVKQKLLFLLVLLLTATTGAWAQEETLLTTIVNTGGNASFKSGSKTFDNIATVTFSGGVSNDNDEWGWYSSGTNSTLTVTAAEGYTITRVKFYTDTSSAFDEEAPFEAILVLDGSDYIAKVNGTSIGKFGVNKIEVYGYAGTPAPPTYTVSLKDGTEDATNWKGKAGEGEYQALPLEGVAAGTAVTVNYNGTKKVKSVKAVKKNTAKTLAEATSEDIGKIAGKDGNIYATKADAEAVATGNAVAMIAYVGTASDCAHGLAIALADESGTKNYEAAGTACSGKAAVTGGTWRLPSDKDWQYMFIGCGSSESYSAPTFAMSKSYSGLASKLPTAQGAVLQTAEYWSSTKDDPNGAWIVVFNGSNATFYMEDKTVEHQVRACLAF